MEALGRWGSNEVVHGYKGPLLLSLVAFVITFVATRTITRMIRAGRGPFHNVSSGGVHLHHSTPGVLLLVAGAFISIGADGRRPGTYLSAAMIGVGASLVLDEFAMIFHLQDVYWAQEGQLSVNVVSLAAACVGLGVAGVSPFGVRGLDDTTRLVRGSVAAALVIHLVFVAVAVLKGKYVSALLGLFLGPVAWARKFYSSRKIERATTCGRAVDARWGPVRERWADFIGGQPSEPNPTPPT